MVTSDDAMLYAHSHCRQVDVPVTIYALPLKAWDEINAPAAKP